MEQRPKEKRERKGARGARKVKTGCRTCRIRHKKCDERRPTCSQCMHSGWKCDLHNMLAISRTPQSAPQPPSSAVWGATTLDPLDVWNFEYFRVVCAKRISLYLRTDLWERLILQAAPTDRVILDGAVAIGALSRNTVPSKCLPRPGFSPGHPAGYSLQKYNLALEGLRKRLGTQSCGPEIALLGSLIFVAFELENGDTDRVRMHISGALAILNDSANLGISKRTDVARIIDALCKVESQSPSALKVRMSLPALPPTFEDINEARDSLNAINGDLNSLCQKRACGSASYESTALPVWLGQDISAFLSHLESWRKSLDNTTKRRFSSESKSANCVLILLIAYEVIFITASTFSCCNESAYDVHLARFLSIVQLAEELLSTSDKERLGALESASHPQLDVAVVQPLFYVASKCRDGHVRREAVQLLAKTRMGGFYDTRLQVKAAFWVIETEETDAGKGELSGHVSETDRLHDLRLDVDNAAESCRVSGWKRDADGQFRECVQIVYADR